MKLKINKKNIIEEMDAEELMTSGNWSEDAWDKLVKNAPKLDDYLKYERTLDETLPPEEPPKPEGTWLKEKYPLFNQETLRMIDKDLDNPKLNRNHIPWDKAIKNTHEFFNTLGQIENSGHEHGGNAVTSAKGLYQFVDANEKTAINRFRRDYPEVAASTNIDETMKENNIDHLDKKDQTTMAYANLTGHGNGKYYFHNVFDGDKQDQMNKVYFKMHHTNPDTLTRINAYRNFGFGHYAKR